MKVEHVQFTVVLVGIYLMFAGAVLWLIFVRRYIRRHGAKPAFAMFNLSPLIDYRTAKMIAKSVGKTPWFLRAFEITFSVPLLIIIAFAVWCVLDP